MKKFSKKDFIDSMQFVAEALGKENISLKDYSDYRKDNPDLNLPSEKTIVLNLGSWNKAKKVANLACYPCAVEKESTNTPPIPEEPALAPDSTVQTSPDTTPDSATEASPDIAPDSTTETSSETTLNPTTQETSDTTPSVAPQTLPDPILQPDPHSLSDIIAKPDLTVPPAEIIDVLLHPDREDFRSSMIRHYVTQNLPNWYSLPEFLKILGNIDRVSREKVIQLHITKKFPNGLSVKRWKSEDYIAIIKAANENCDYFAEAAYTRLYRQAPELIPNTEEFIKRGFISFYHIRLAIGTQPASCYDEFENAVSRLAITKKDLAYLLKYCEKLSYYTTLGLWLKYISSSTQVLPENIIRTIDFKNGKTKNIVDLLVKTIPLY